MLRSSIAKQFTATINYTVDAPTCTNEEQGHVRLVDGVSMYEGRVEVCASGEWGTICNHNWDNQEALVICRQLGFQTDGIINIGAYRIHQFIITFYPIKEQLLLLGINMEVEYYISVILAALEMRPTFFPVLIHNLITIVQTLLMLESYVKVL